MVEDGTRAKPVPIKDVSYFLEVSTVIEATGQVPDLSYIPDQMLKNLKLQNEEVFVDQDGMTSVPGIFAAGDVVNPKKDTISAIADSNIAVNGILKYLGLSEIEYLKLAPMPNSQ